MATQACVTSDASFPQPINITEEAALSACCFLLTDLGWMFMLILILEAKYVR